LVTTNARERTAEAYRRFAAVEARGRSPLYERLAEGVAADADVLAFLLTLPGPKRQPNLLFAAVRHRLGTPWDWPSFRDRLLAEQDAVREVMMARSTQTNEPARCATLLPILAALPQPLALIEVGASAGLCLLPDLYGYDYGRARLMARQAGTGTPVFPCVAGRDVPLPSRLPHIVWRAGLDLKPMCASRPEHRAWLEDLVWPEQTERLGRLRQALMLAAEARPRVVAGDLRADLAGLAAQMPSGATRVIFHSAVLAYVASPVEREGFAAQVQQLADHWIANEVPGAIPGLAASFVEQARGRFVLCLDGKPLAWTDPHGAAVQWIDAA
jgi:hypothetical protein